MGVIRKLICQKEDSLKKIDLSDNDLRNGGMQTVAEILKENTSIETVLLQRNSITFEGLQLLCGALINTSENNVTIREIDIRFNMIEDSQLKVLYAVIQKNKDLRRIKYTLNVKENETKFNLFHKLKEQGKNADEIR
jgi:Ran GTPase-activating protein (RanGAP) involved in mRNA processing and transport